MADETLKVAMPFLQRLLDTLALFTSFISIIAVVMLLWRLFILLCGLEGWAFVKSLRAYLLGFGFSAGITILCGYILTFYVGAIAKEKWHWQSDLRWVFVLVVVLSPVAGHFGGRAWMREIWRVWGKSVFATGAICGMLVFAVIAVATLPLWEPVAHDWIKAASNGIKSPETLNLRAWFQYLYDSSLAASPRIVVVAAALALPLVYFYYLFGHVYCLVYGFLFPVSWWLRNLVAISVWAVLALQGAVYGAGLKLLGGQISIAAFIAAAGLGLTVPLVAGLASVLLTTYIMWIQAFGPNFREFWHGFDMSWHGPDTSLDEDIKLTHILVASLRRFRGSLIGALTAKRMPANDGLDV